ncbi:hypothetical protein CYMTET_3457 [Cymbomonas tetramitiformis]|uniref:Uncharacterized protein n=1 Tax=Cymbomonas tetramitiformis TaxID=36881 RepID=A0AAE0H530_9CHLO|nr:hypothetical protein CYMTET_3457 [Cymbomonas tetramitiformis]
MYTENPKKNLTSFLKSETGDASKLIFKKEEGDPGYKVKCDTQSFGVIYFDGTKKYYSKDIEHAVCVSNGDYIFFYEENVDDGNVISSIAYKIIYKYQHMEDDECLTDDDDVIKDPCGLPTFHITPDIPEQENSVTKHNDAVTKELFEWLRRLGSPYRADAASALGASPYQQRIVRDVFRRTDCDIIKLAINKASEDEDENDDEEEDDEHEDEDEDADEGDENDEGNK